jgi:hypothetical protein
VSWANRTSKRRSEHEDIQDGGLGSRRYAMFIGLPLFLTGRRASERYNVAQRQLAHRTKLDGNNAHGE